MGRDFSRTVGSIRALALIPVLAWVGCSAPPGSPDAEGAAPPPVASPGPVIAVVNGAPIHERQFENAWSVERARLEGEGEELTPEKWLERRQATLRLLIAGELIYQTAKAKGVQVPEDAIVEQLRVARSQFSSDEAFEEHLRASGMTLEDRRKSEERRLLLAAYVRSVTPDTEIDDAEALRMYRQEKDRLVSDTQVRPAHIIVRVLPNASAEQRQAARVKIDEAYRRLQAGEDFAELAEEYSESPFATQGGDLGLFSRGRALPEFEEIVFNTPVGQTTAVFETPHGYNIVRILERREGKALNFDEVKIDLLMVLAREQKDETLKRHVEQLRAEAEIRYLDPTLQPDQ
jgi:peptidyl-prolyl cis-trans isomerase C